MSGPRAIVLVPPHLEEAVRRSLPEANPEACGVAIGSRLDPALVAAAGAVAVIAGQPETVAAWMAHGGDRHEALVAASAIFAEAAGAARRTGALIISETELDADRAGAVQRLARHAGLDAATADGDHAAPPPGPGAAPSEASLALEVYRRLPLRPGATAWWPASLFRSLEPGFPGEIDIAGRARALLFGPYVQLPAGTWTAEIVFEVCADGASYDYQVDFGVVHDLASVIARPRGAGRHSLTLTQTFHEPALAEVRIILARAAFHGALTFLGAQITLVEDAALAAAAADARNDPEFAPPPAQATSQSG